MYHDLDNIYVTIKVWTYNYCTLISLQSTVSALHFGRWYYGSTFIQILVMGSERQAHNVTEWVIALQGHPMSSIFDFGTNRKRMYIFLLVINSNLDLILTIAEIRWLKLKVKKSTSSTTPLLFGLKFRGVSFRVDPWCWDMSRARSLS